MMRPAPGIDDLSGARASGKEERAVRLGPPAQDHSTELVEHGDLRIGERLAALEEAARTSSPSE